MYTKKYEWVLNIFLFTPPKLLMAGVVRKIREQYENVIFLIILFGF